MFDTKFTKQKKKNVLLKMPIFICIREKHLYLHFDIHVLRNIPVQKFIWKPNVKKMSDNVN